MQAFAAIIIVILCLGHSLADPDVRVIADRTTVVANYPACTGVTFACPGTFYGVWAEVADWTAGRPPVYYSCYDAAKHAPLYTVNQLSSGTMGAARDRPEDEWYTNGVGGAEGTGKTFVNGLVYHRGHMAVRSDCSNSRLKSLATSHVINRVPQKGQFNSYVWMKMEKAIQSFVHKEATAYAGNNNDGVYRNLCVITVATYNANNLPTATENDLHGAVVVDVSIPTRMAKILYFGTAVAAHGARFDASNNDQAAMLDLSAIGAGYATYLTFARAPSLRPLKEQWEEVYPDGYSHIQAYEAVSCAVEPYFMTSTVQMVNGMFTFARGAAPHCPSPHGEDCVLDGVERVEYLDNLVRSPLYADNQFEIHEELRQFSWRVVTAPAAQGSIDPYVRISRSRNVRERAQGTIKKKFARIQYRCAKRPAPAIVVPALVPVVATGPAMDCNIQDATSCKAPTSNTCKSIFSPTLKNKKLNDFAIYQQSLTTSPKFGLTKEENAAIIAYSSESEKLYVKLNCYLNNPGLSETIPLPMWVIELKQLLISALKKARSHEKMTFRATSMAIPPKTGDVLQNLGFLGTTSNPSYAVAFTGCNPCYRMEFHGADGRFTSQFGSSGVQSDILLTVNQCWKVVDVEKNTPSIKVKYPWAKIGGNDIYMKLTRIPCTGKEKNILENESSYDDFNAEIEILDLEASLEEIEQEFI